MNTSDTVLAALRAISEGYEVFGKEDRYVVVANPQYSPENGSAPNLVIDVEALASLSPAKEARCCSAVSRCSWQRHNGMDSICPTCVAALSGAEAKPEIGSPMWAAEQEKLTGTCAWCLGAGSVRTRDYHDNLSMEPCPRCDGKGVIATLSPATETARPLNSGEVEQLPRYRFDTGNHTWGTDGGSMNECEDGDWIKLSDLSAALSSAPSTPDGWRDILDAEEAALIEYRDLRCRGDDEIKRHAWTVANARLSEIGVLRRKFIEAGLLPTPPAGGSDE